MSNEIQRFDQPPKPVKILGAPDTQVPAQPQIVDKTTRQEPEDHEVRFHYDEVTEADQIRVGPRAPDEPQVRIRSSDKEAWGRVKRVED
jgi:hypothetical protein